MSNAFAGASNMTYSATDTPDLSDVTYMSFMFDGAISFNGNLSSWDVSSVTAMPYMFQAATSFNQPLNAWDVSSVTDMSSMFIGATSFDQSLNDWNVSSVEYMPSMFLGATDFDGSISAWNVSSVTTMHEMFNAASSFNQPLNDWDVSSVTYMANMFDDAFSFDQNLGNWYVVPNSMSIAKADVPGIVGSISAQNTALDGHSPEYNIVNGGDHTRFAIVNGNQLNMTSADTKSAYTVNVTASDGTVFEDGNNWRVLDVTVTAADDSAADAFVTTWRTTSEDQSITINFVGDDINIDWGDGATDTGVDEPQTHIYTDAGDYTVSVTGGLTGLTLDRPLDIFGNYHGPVPELASIDQWGNISWTNMSNAFAGASNMVYMATDTPDLRLVTDMSGMFASATAFDGDLSSWDVSSVTDMSFMFATAASFNGTISSWDVSSVTDMSFMFATAASFNGTISSWDVSSVTDMSDMFQGTTSFDQPLNDWDVSSVTDMNEMFRDAASFDRPLNDWDVSSVNSTFNMFQGTTSFDQPLNDWDVSSVTDMNDMFSEAVSFNQPLNTWDVSSVTDMSYMFVDATYFNQPLNAWDVSSVTNMEEMFLGATAFDQNLAGWYVVQDPPVLTANATFPIRAQNGYLDGLVSTYSIDDTRFVMDDKTLSLNSTNLPPAGIYPLDITAPAVLGEPNAGEEGHTRTLIVTVKGEHRPFITTWRTTLPNQEITINFVDPAWTSPGATA